MICIKELIIEEGRFTNVEMFDTIIKYLRTLPELVPSFEILDYEMSTLRLVDLVQNEDYEVFAHVNTGGCEGVYIDCYLKNKDNVIDLGTIKTLEERMEGYIKLGQLAGAFVLAGDNYLWFNEHKFKLKEEGDCVGN